MEKQVLCKNVPMTPAFIIDETDVRRRLGALSELRQESGCKVLYSMKALPLQSILEMVAVMCDGISASSLFEARLAREVCGESVGVHLTTPGLRREEFNELSGLCSHISFNSLNQWQSMVGSDREYSPGLRINPKLSYLHDPRFDPCRPYSKLGVDIDVLDGLQDSEALEGLHFHTVFSSQDFAPLRHIVDRLRQGVLDRYRSLQWLNLGGGYLYSQITRYRPFVELVNSLREEYGVEVYIEPGNDVVKHAGYLVSSVVDCFASSGKTVAILDTSVNHHPEVFEYQYQPELLQPRPGNVPVILAGSTCLAGDVFGEYPFGTAPKIGDRIVFKNCGAYSLIKANRFNGYNLPDIYHWDGGNMVRKKHYEYQDYRRQWQVDR